MIAQGNWEDSPDKSSARGGQQVTKRTNPKLEVCRPVPKHLTVVRIVAENDEALTFKV